MDTAVLFGIARRVSKVSGVSEISTDEFGNLRVDQYLPRYAQLAKQRRIFGGTSGTGTALAPIQAIPTTTTQFALFNGESPGGKSYVVLQAACWSVSGTAGLGMSLLGSVAIAPVTGVKPTAYASSVVSNLSGSGSTNAVFTSAVTLIGTPAWMVLASRDQVSAVSVGSGLTADVQGMLVIPPQYVGGLAVLAPVGTTCLFGASLIWAEVELDLE